MATATLTDRSGSSSGEAGADASRATLDVVVSVGASFPAVQALRGYRLASPVAMVGVGIDL